MNSGCFKKGDVPWNKGKPMDSNTYKKVKNTMFKKGHMPATTKHFGKPYLYTRIRNNGYVEKRWMIHYNKKRRSYLKYLCDKNNIDMTGRKPRLKPDYNIEIEPTINDILLVSNEENMRLNSVHRYPEELRRLIQVYGALNRQLNKLK